MTETTLLQGEITEDPANQEIEVEKLLTAFIRALDAERTGALPSPAEEGLVPAGRNPSSPTTPTSARPAPDELAVAAAALPKPGAAFAKPGARLTLVAGTRERS